MTELTDRNCFTCTYARYHDGYFGDYEQPPEDGWYDCDLGLPGAMENEALVMPDCSGYERDMK